MEIHAAEHQYLTFLLGAETYALGISRVREVLEYRQITKVPQMPDHIVGVINLRGSSVPVMDLRTRLQLPQSAFTVNTCIIIVDIGTKDAPHLVGAIADSVREVVDIAPDAIEPAPRIGTSLQAQYLTGIGKHNEHFIMMLSATHVFNDSLMEQEAAPVA